MLLRQATGDLLQPSHSFGYVVEIFDDGTHDEPLLQELKHRASTAHPEGTRVTCVTRQESRLERRPETLGILVRQLGVRLEERGDRVLRGPGLGIRHGEVNLHVPRPRHGGSAYARLASAFRTSVEHWLARLGDAPITVELLGVNWCQCRKQRIAVAVGLLGVGRERCSVAGASFDEFDVRSDDCVDSVQHVRPLMIVSHRVTRRGSERNAPITDT